MKLSIAKRGICLSGAIAVSIMITSNVAMAAWCQIDWDDDGVVELEDYVGSDPVRGFWPEIFLYSYNPAVYSILFPSGDPNRIDVNHDGAVNIDDLMGKLNPAAMSEGFFVEYIVYNYYPAYYADFFPETDQCVTCSSDSDCGLGGYCRRPVPHDGESCDGIGRCEPIPPHPICDGYDYLVCGCNGITYNRACDAVGAGTSIASEGACPGFCVTDTDCDDNELCLFEPGVCGGDKKCVPVPTDCSLEDEAPVCGCNSVTYNNECEATLAGASVMLYRECECTDRDECHWPLAYCKTPDYDCAGQGMCTYRSETCFTWAQGEFHPYCTCEGLMMRFTLEQVIAWGESIKNDGLCAANIACSSGSSCPEGMFCTYQWDTPCLPIDDYLCQTYDRVPCVVDGQCQSHEYCYVDTVGNCGGEGYCMPREDGSECTSNYNPVCGCDGVTYDNSCLARAAHVNINRLGDDCRASCVSNLDCLENEFCEFPETGCGGEGRCQPIPTTCTEPGVMVCGCDGIEYANLCEARMAGTSVVSTGRCPCSATEQCNTEEGEVCIFEPWLCGGHGTCIIPEADCSDEQVAPVCGCDALTYDNECAANAAGTSVAFGGSCCTSSEDCFADEYCRFEIGSCGGTGVCMNMPLECPLEFDPALGCDGNTYDNAQCAAANGVSLVERPNIAIETGHYYSCVLKANHTVECWGLEGFGAEYVNSITPPPDQFAQISVGNSHGCGVTLDGVVNCWGDNKKSQSSPPSGLYLQVSAGRFHTCGLKVDQTVHCWGDDYNGRLDAPPGTFTAVDAGRRHSCALRPSGLVECWGTGYDVVQREVVELTPPIGAFQQFDTADNYHCGVRSNGNLECLGGRQPPAGVFETVSVGWVDSCGVRPNGSLACWHNPTYGSYYGYSEGLDGPFAAVSVGSEHTCALTLDGSVRCWGSDESGQSTPPYVL